MEAVTKNNIVSSCKKTISTENIVKEKISNVDANLSTEENSLVNAIINELGGREFK